MREKADRELVLPQKIERDKRGCYIGCELRRVYLVKEDFFFECHSAISFVVLRLVRCFDFPNG